MLVSRFAVQKQPVLAHAQYWEHASTSLSEGVWVTGERLAWFSKLLVL